MAAASASRSTGSQARNAAIKIEPEDSGGAPSAGEGPVHMREPVLTLMAPVSGLQPLVWSQDHRLAACTTSAISLMELVCDIYGNQQDLTLHRTSISVPTDVLQLRVGPEEELEEARHKFSSHPDPTISQAFISDRVMNPHMATQKGVKYTSWSPLGCDVSGRCLLACLTLDHRLTIHNSMKRLQWSVVADLTRRYSERLAERGYAKKDGKPPEANLLNFEELQRRFRMQTPLRMEWSSLYTVKQVEADNTCREEEIVFLAVLMENGDLVLWRFRLPCVDGTHIEFYDLIESGVTRPSDLAWWEYEGSDNRMSGLIVGSEVGPVRIMPVNLAGVKGYFTLKQPVILWQQVDEIPVENIKCVPIFHPIQKSNCSLVVATRGCYVFWCLLMISPAGLNVHNSHIAGLHSLPVVSLAVTRQGVTVYTCSIDGWVKKLTPTFTETTLIFAQENMLLPDTFPGRRMHGIAVSHNGAYIALASTQGIVSGHHPVSRSYQVNFVTAKTPETAATQILKSPSQSLYKAADLLDLVRWRVLKEQRIPPSLRDQLDKKIQEADTPYLWRFKLFLLRILKESLKKVPDDPLWKPTYEDAKVVIREEGAAEDQAVKEEDDDEPRNGVDEEDLAELIRAVSAEIASVEARLSREHMKKVLGEVYLNIWTAVNTSIPTCGLVEYLSKDTSDRASEVLIGHIKKKMNKQTFSEHCNLCEEVLPFTSAKDATCKNGHMWLRCVLSFQACQSLAFKRCLLLDGVAGVPEPGAPEWIKKILTGPCTFCDSPMI
ncbi:general transcription factor 3C polypeptide 4 [Myripristis murdjan]|uniref:Ral transcription factor IIIC subunit 4 n=1 Tax=Myripristis murdjan TaxID=586833 RepID=A0A667YYI5_9TELE|nr:general transcription factor 3C polypeptide 4 [Myripristis murdjan]